MISYVLVFFVSLSTGQPTHASLEGPMATDWCEQLIRQDRYRGDDGTSRKTAACMSEEDARRVLQSSFCRRSSGPRPHWPSIEFDCAVPAPQPESVSPEDDPTPSASRGSVTADPPEEAPAGSAEAEPTAPAPPVVAEPPPSTLPEPFSTAPESIPQVPGKQFHLGTAASALIAQAHGQSKQGHNELAAATIERALRIEPENPLLWIELGHVRMDEGHAAQADGLYRKALSLATGDSQTQATAWLLIAESLRVRGRNVEAAEAEGRAASVAPR